MKNLVKIFAVSTAILSLTTLGVDNARAGGWPIAAGVMSGVAAGAIVGTAIATAAAPPIYAYPPPAYGYGYAAPAYAAPGYAAPVVVPPAPYYYPPVAYRAYYPGVRFGWGWGRPYGYRHFHRW